MVAVPVISMRRLGRSWPEGSEWCKGSRLKRKVREQEDWAFETMSGFCLTIFGREEMISVEFCCNGFYVWVHMF